MEPSEPEFPSFLYWFHFANGTLQPGLVRAFTFRMLGLEPGEGMAKNLLRRLGAAIDHVEASLGQVAYFAGERFTAADIMMVFSLTTMRRYQPIELGPYPHIRAYLQRIGARPAYRRAMTVADPDLTPLLT